MALSRTADLADRDLQYLAQILINYFKNVGVKNAQLSGTYGITLVGDIKILLL